MGGLFFLDAPGGTGKTFVTNLLRAKVKQTRKIALVVASSGIAATLLDGGRTAHSAFKLPFNLAKRENPTCNISRSSTKAKLFQECKLIIWDEATFAKPCQSSPKANADAVNACIKSSYLWSEVNRHSLKTNMRVQLSGDKKAGRFSQRLLKNLALDNINAKLLEQLPGDSTRYKSMDTVPDPDQVVHYPTEFLNSLAPSGVPRQRLQTSLLTVGVMCFVVAIIAIVPTFALTTCVFEIIVREAPQDEVIIRSGEEDILTLCRAMMTGLEDQISKGNTPGSVCEETEPGLLTLFIADGNPAPVEVTWYRASAGAEQLIPLYNVVTYSYENVEQHFFNTTSTVTVPQNGLNDEDIVRVEIAHPALDEALVVNITADVQYGPSEVIITPRSPAELVEGEPAEVVCESDGNPRTTITWKKNQQVIAEGASLTFDLVQSSDAGNDYSCVAQNKYGVKSRQYQINVGATVSGAMIAGIIIAILAVFMVAAIVGYMYVNKMSCFAPAAKPIQPTTTAPAFETQASHPVKDEAWAAGTGQAYENKVEKDDEGFHTIDLEKAASETADPKALDDNTPSRSRESYAAAMSKPQPMPTPSATIAEDEMGESV
ncbi:PREDICTED: uncharacterized protein LOC106816068 [Priapulus caudatus]|uniref:ATP-dependent DNA helicase n=1 Tax=Priapulus caudatus TaxID=37621 RepID=A0ABM1EV89_PRICU|nr:PREDICTED: uncharacterized protein LOC106816068 [Priapulus caudatus]